PAGQSLHLALALPLRNQAELRDLLHRLYDPVDPRYGQYLTPTEFAQRFGPTEADYAQLITFAKRNGFTIVGTHSNRTLLDVEAPVSTIERAFKTRLNRYQAPDGREFHAPGIEPQIPGTLAGRLSGIVGLDSAAVWRPHSVRRPEGPVA